MVDVVLEVVCLVSDEREQGGDLGSGCYAVRRHGGDEVGRCLGCGCTFGGDGCATAGVGGGRYLEEHGDGGAA